MGINVIYDGIELSQYFSVVDIVRSILPSRTNYSDNAPYSDGATYSGYKYEPLAIQISILINDDLNEKKETLASILNVKEPKKLVFTDETNRYWNAVIDGSTDIDEILHLGTGVLTFICLDPFAYSVETTTVEVVDLDDRRTTVDVEGTYETYPTFEVDFKEDTKFFGITSNKGTVQIGSPDYVDGTSYVESESLIDTKSFTGFKYNDLPLNTEGGSTQGAFNIRLNNKGIRYVRVAGIGYSTISAFTADGTDVLLGLPAKTSNSSSFSGVITSSPYNATDNSTSTRLSADGDAYFDFDLLQGYDLSKITLLGAYDATLRQIMVSADGIHFEEVFYDFTSPVNSRLYTGNISGNTASVLTGKYMYELNKIQYIRLSNKSYKEVKAINLDGTNELYGIVPKVIGSYLVYDLNNVKSNIRTIQYVLNNEENSIALAVSEDNVNWKTLNSIYHVNRFSSTTFPFVNTTGNLILDISDDIVEDDYMLKVEDYGDISIAGFNGPAFSTDIESTKNFDTTLELDFGTLDVEGTKNGKFEFNITDSNDNIIAGISLTDTASIPLMSPQFYTSLNSYSVSSSINSSDLNLGAELTSESLGRWNNFKGYLRIVKSGNDIVFIIQKMDSDNLVRKYAYTFSSSKYSTEYATKIGFWFSSFGTSEPLDTASIRSLKLIKNNVDDWINVPNLFREGDNLVINNLLGRVYLNNIEFMDYLDIGSTFFSLDSDVNNLLFTFNSTVAPDVKITYNNCYI